MQELVRNGKAVRLRAERFPLPCVHGHLRFHRSAIRHEWDFGIIEGRRAAAARSGRILAVTLFLRTEEHTSELQSLMRSSYAVFCLKKKTQTSSDLTTKPTNY